MSDIPFKYTVRVKSEDKTYGFATASGVAQFCLTYGVNDLEITRNGQVIELSKDGKGISISDIRSLLEGN
jgi:hypothetical protein